MSNSATVISSNLPVKFFNSDILFLKQIVVVRDTNADITVLSGVAGKYIGLFGMEYNISADHDLTLKSGSTTHAVLSTIRGVGNRIGMPFFTTKVGEDLVIAFSANVTFAVLWAQYFTYLAMGPSR